MSWWSLLKASLNIWSSLEGTGRGEIMFTPWQRLHNTENNSQCSNFFPYIRFTSWHTTACCLLVYHLMSGFTGIFKKNCLPRHILLSGQGIFKQHPALHSYSHIFSPLGVAQYNHCSFWPMSTFSVAGLYGSHKATFMEAVFGGEVGGWNSAFPVTSLLPKLEDATLVYNRRV